jgi:NAD(P)-dependent dehydrogenase (short-subunit alcohol dehydrogenase family)
VCEPGVKRALILGGYGAFGRRVAERLARVSGLEVAVAGRDLTNAEACVAELVRSAQARIVPACLNGAKIGPGDLQELRPAVLINATGPYQEQDYRLARACIAAGVHYLDLADARDFVTGIAALDAEARAADVLVVSGASTVPAVSGAVADAYAPRFAHLQTVTTIISPGNRFDPGLATTRSILTTLGRPIANGPRRQAVRGWQGLRRVVLPGLGPRWIGHCDAPDRALFPHRYPALQHADVYAALEVGVFQLGLWAVSWFVRAGVIRDPAGLAKPMLAMKRKLGFLGSDKGGMLVRLEGLDRAGKRQRIDWHLVAGSGHGPYVPATASVLLAKRLLDGSLTARGAMPCVGLFTLDDFLAEIADLDMEVGTA